MLILYMMLRTVSGAFLCFTHLKYLPHNQLAWTVVISAAFGIAEPILEFALGVAHR